MPVEFKEHEHPRDKTGRWAKKGEAGPSLSGPLNDYGYKAEEGGEAHFKKGEHRVSVHAPRHASSKSQTWYHHTSGESGSGAKALRDHLAAVHGASQEEQREAARGLESYLRMTSDMYGRGQVNHSSFVMENGKQFFSDADTYRGRRGQQHMCYMNATNRAIDHPDKYAYVEGYVTVHGVSIAHAWNVDRETGRVVDPTIRSNDGIGAYVGVPIKDEYLMRSMVRTGVYGVLDPMTNRQLYTTDSPSEVVDKTVPGGRQSSTQGSRYVPPGQGTPATDLMAEHETPTLDEFYASLPSETVTKLKETSARVRNGTSTDARVDEGGHREADGRYTAERRRLHDKIVDEVLSPAAIKRAKPKEGEAPTFTILGGRAGSGKSWLMRGEEAPVDTKTALVIDNDEIKAMIPEYEGWNAALVHEEASDIAERVIDTARQLGLNMVLDGTMRSYGSAKERVDRFRDSGYGVRGYYMFASPEVAARQAVERFAHRGRLVEPAYVLGSTSNEASFDALRDDFDDWGVYRAHTDGEFDPRRTAHGGKSYENIRKFMRGDR